MSVEPVHVADVLKEVTAALEPIAASAGVTLNASTIPSDIPMVRADLTRFTQILMNFGSNAIKYNRAGGSLSFLVHAEDNVVRVTVKDNGYGIPRDKQSKIFQPFQRAGQETGSIEGTGIGLAISKRLAELMHGGVGFRSTPGDGSEFWVEVPKHVQRGAVVAPPPREETSARLVLEGVPQTILYVEDNPANIAFMEDLLGAFDEIELLVATSAEGGIEIARKMRPTAIIMDINLPGSSGLDALRMLREIDETRDIPVIALTAAASERDKERGERAGFYRYLTKPVKVDELEAALASLVNPGSKNVARD